MRLVGSGSAGTGVGEIVFSVPALTTDAPARRRVSSATKVVKECIMLLLALACCCFYDE